LVHFVVMLPEKLRKMFKDRHMTSKKGFYDIKIMQVIRQRLSVSCFGWTGPELFSKNLA